MCIACACTHVQHKYFLTFQYFASHIHIFQSVHVARVSHSMRCLASRTNLRAHADVIFCHMHMTWCTCACTYVLHAHVCAQIQHFLTFQTSLRTSTFVHVAIARGSHSMRCHVASPQEQIGACRCLFLYDMVHMYCMCMYAHRYNTSSHFSTSLRTSTFSDVHIARASQHAL